MKYRLNLNGLVTHFEMMEMVDSVCHSLGFPEILHYFRRLIPNSQEIQRIIRMDSDWHLE